MSSPIRVAYTLEQCWHRVPGGTAVAGIEMARALAGRPEVGLIGVAAYHRRVPAPGWRPPVEVRHLPLPRAALYQSWHYLRRPRVQIATGPVDLIHATGFALPPRSAPLVTTVHDLAFLKNRDHYTTWGIAFFERSLKLALKEADLVLCPSDATARDCIDAGFERDRLKVVPFGLDAAPVAEEDVRAARSKHGLTRPYLLWVGTIEPRKNLAGLLEACSKVDSDLDIVLVGPEGWNENVTELSRRFGVEPKTLGFLPRTELASLYAGAELFCWPSHTEGFGFPVLEAMAQGTPVVTSQGTSTEEIAGEAAVLVDPSDATSIAEGIRSVLSDSALATRLAREGKARAAEYTWERTANLVLDAYADVVGRSS